MLTELSIFHILTGFPTSSCDRVGFSFALSCIKNCSFKQINLVKNESILSDLVIHYSIYFFSAIAKALLKMNKALNQTKILVIDDHELVLGGTLGVLKENYPDAEFFTAQTARDALLQVNSTVLDLVVSDLSIPETLGESSRTDTGIQLLKTLMEKHPTINLVVQSTYLEALIRIKPEIDNHQGGFTVADKSIPSSEMLNRVDWSLRGLTHTKDLRGNLQGLEVKQEWLTLLALAFEEGLQDKQIAKQMCVSERTVRNYWTKIQDVLEVYPETGKNIRIQTQIRAREEGLID